MYNDPSGHEAVPDHSYMDSWFRNDPFGGGGQGGGSSGGPAAWLRYVQRVIIPKIEAEKKRIAEEQYINKMKALMAKLGPKLKAFVEKQKSTTEGTEDLSTSGGEQAQSSQPEIIQKILPGGRYVQIIQEGGVPTLKAGFENPINANLGKMQMEIAAKSYVNVLSVASGIGSLTLGSGTLGWLSTTSAGVNTIKTVIDKFQGNASWIDVGMSAMGTIPGKIGVVGGVIGLGYTVIIK